MKQFLKSLFLAVCCISTIAGHAQEVTLTDVSARGYDGVKSLNGNAYYTFYFGEKTAEKGMANFVLDLFDQDLKKINSTNIELKKGSELAGSAFNGSNFLFVFVDWTRKTLTMVTLDQKGNIIKKNEQEDVKRSLLDVDNYTNILGVGNDFVLVKPEKDKKYGFTVERIDPQLNVKWSKPYMDEKKASFALLSKSKNDRIFILDQEKPNRTSDKFEDFIVSLDPATGNEVYKYSLFDGEATGWPSSFVVDDNGNVAAAGMYFNGQKFDDVNSDGIFFVNVGPDGSKKAYSKTPWKNIMDKIKDDKSGLLLGGKTKTMIMDIIKKSDGNYLVVAETWRKSNNADNTGDLVTKSVVGGLGSGTSTTSTGEKKIGFTVMDFILFNFAPSGELSNITKVRKDPRSIVITGRLTDETGNAIAMEMKEQGYFTYQYFIQNNGTPFIVYRDYDGMKQKAYFLPLDATDTKNVASIDMNKEVGENMNKMVKGLSKFSNGAGSQMEYNSSANPWERGTSMKWKGIVPAKPGYMLMYDYTNGTLNMWLVKIPV